MAEVPVDWFYILHFLVMNVPAERNCQKWQQTFWRYLRSSHWRCLWLLIESYNSLLRISFQHIQWTTRIQSTQRKGHSNVKRGEEIASNRKENEKMKITFFFSSFSHGRSALKAWRDGPSSRSGNVVLSIAIMALITCSNSSNKLTLLAAGTSYRTANWYRHFAKRKRLKTKQNLGKAYPKQAVDATLCIQNLINLWMKIILDKT